MSNIALQNALGSIKESERNADHKTNSDSKTGNKSSQHMFIAKMEFNDTGKLIITADNFGHVFNVFKLNPDFNNSCDSLVEHLYCLKRGETEANITCLKFSSDSRMIGVSTSRGTTHMYP